MVNNKMVKITCFLIFFVNSKALFLMKSKKHEVVEEEII